MENRQQEIEQARKELEQIKSKADDVQARLDRLEKQEPERWRAELGGGYWCADNTGAVVYVTDRRGETSGGCYAIGNYFRTKEDTEPFAKVFREMAKTPPDYKFGEEVEWVGELGHRVVDQWYGYKRQIAMHWMGWLRRREQ